jgi:hypothetical protein
MKERMGELSPEELEAIVKAMEIMKKMLD